MPRADAVTTPSASASDPPRLLVIAFSCDPDEGSEAGAGWIFGRIAASVGETWLLYRSEGSHDDRLRRSARAMPDGHRLHLIPVSQPYLAGHPPTTPDWPGERLEYLLWQVRALRVARRIAKRERIDLVWHASWSTVWLGSIGGLIGPRFIWGPVGGGVGPPWRVLGGLGLRGASVELVRSLVRTVARWSNPLVRLAWRRADLILAQNAETARWLPGSARPRVEVMHHIVIDERRVTLGRPTRADRSPTALFAGRLVPWKGAWLAIDAIAKADGWRLIIVGEGGDEARLRERALTRGVSGRVTFRGHLERDDLLRVMHDEADVFLFPSLHEEGGWVVGEALASGLPVVCVDRGGPPVMGGHGVPLGSAGETAERLARALTAALGSPVPAAPTYARRRDAIVAVLRERGLFARVIPDRDPAETDTGPVPVPAGRTDRP